MGETLFPHILFLLELLNLNQNLLKSIKISKFLVFIKIYFKGWVTVFGGCNYMKTLRNSIWLEKNFILYFWATFISKLGDKIYVIALPWLVYELTKSPLGMGTMFLVETLPFIFISPIAGVLADYVSRKAILVISGIVQAIGIGAIPLLNLINILQIWHIFIIGFIVASAGACFSVVKATIIPQLFEKNKLIKANSMFQFMNTSTALVGSAIAGILIGKIGVFNVLWLNVITFFPILLAILLLKLKNSVSQKPFKSTSFEQYREGVRYLIDHPVLGPLTLLTLIVNIGNGALVSTIVYFSRDKLYLSSEQIGWVYGGAAAAQILAILMVPFFNKKGTPMKLMLINIIVSSTGIILAAFSQNWIGLLIGVALQSAPVIMFNVYNQTFRQRVVPAHLFGRVNGNIMMLSLSTLPLAGFLTGIFAEIINIRYIYLLLGLVTILIVVKYWFSPLRSYTEEKEYKPVS